VYRGDASAIRPDGVAEDFAAYVYLRPNPAGAMREHWYHAQGCRNWLIVERDTRTHVIAGARMAGSGHR
jgi:sarcosine oxidase subunit delta